MGGKVRQILPGGTGAEKLDTFRRAMAGSGDPDGVTKDKKAQIEEILATAKRQVDRRKNLDDDEQSDEDDIPMPSIVGLGKNQDRWDVETILSTFHQRPQ